MKSRRVSFAICLPLVLALSQFAIQSDIQSANAEPHGAGAVGEEPDAEPALTTTHAAISAAVKSSKAIAMLDRYNRATTDQVRFLVVVDRLAGNDSLHPTVDLLATRDGRLFLIGDKSGDKIGDKSGDKSIRAASNRDLETYKFTVGDATTGLKSAARRPISLLVPKEFVSAL